MVKHWKITGSIKNGWSIMWGYSDTIGNKFPYFVGSQKTPKTWKTIIGARKAGLKMFGIESSN